MNTPLRSSGFPPIESNYTMCPNMFFDRVVGFYEPCVVNVVAILIRETLGWLNQHTGTRKVEAELPLSAFVKHGMSQESARKGLKLAAEAGLILKTEQASPKDPARYALRWEDPKTQQQAIKDDRRAFQAKWTRAGGLRDTLSKRDVPQNRVIKSSTLKSSSQEVRVLDFTPPPNKGILKKSYPEKKEEEEEKKAPCASEVLPSVSQEQKDLTPPALKIEGATPQGGDFSPSLSPEKETKQQEPERPSVRRRAQGQVFKRVKHAPPCPAVLEQMIQARMGEIQSEDAAAAALEEAK